MSRESLVGELKLCEVSDDNHLTRRNDVSKYLVGVNVKFTFTVQFSLANYLSWIPFFNTWASIYAICLVHETYRCQHVIISTIIVITSVSLEYLWPTTPKELNVSNKLSFVKLYIYIYFFLTLVMRAITVFESFQNCLIFLISLLLKCATWQFETQSHMLLPFIFQETSVLFLNHNI